MAALTTRPDIVLASASATRTRLLSEAGISHICEPADIDEDTIKSQWTGTPENLALKLAEEKACTVSLRHPDAWTIGCDQVLAFDGQVFSKPGTRDQVRNQLSQLRANTHQLISAVYLVQNGNSVWSHTDTAVLQMRDFSNAFLDTYLNQVGPNVLASVGAYHLEGLGAQLFEKVDGDYFTILGLPLIPLLTSLRSMRVILS